MRATPAIVVLLLVAGAPAQGAAVGDEGRWARPMKPLPLASPAAAAPSSSAAEAISAIAEGDEHYARRAEGAEGSRPNAGEITRAIAEYDRAAADGRSVEARWKLARALYFVGAYTDLDDAGKRAAFDRARRVGDEALTILAQRHAPAGAALPLDPPALAALVRGDSDAAPSLFWTAVGWGQWAIATNKLEAARRGAAHRIRDDCLALIALDPAFEDGGGYRILGRLHDRAPRIPLLTGWVSRPEGVRLLRLAVALAPHNPINLQFLAEALVQAGQRAEAVRIEESIVASTPDPAHLVEVRAIQHAARENLRAWKE